MTPTFADIAADLRAAVPEGLRAEVDAALAASAGQDEPGETEFPVLTAADVEGRVAAEHASRAEERLAAARRECYGDAEARWGKAALSEVRCSEGVLAAARGYASDAAGIRAGRGLIVCGEPDVGKSHLAAAICNEVMRHGLRCRFVNVPAMLASMEGYGERMAFASSLTRCDLVVLDDLGTERDSAYAAELLFLAVDALYTSMTAALVTTNLTAAELADPSGLSAKRILGRLKEGARVIDYRGPSMRTGAGR